MSDLSNTPAIVVGASRGLGHGIAAALAGAGAPVVAMSRTPAEFDELASGSGAIRTEVIDAGDAAVATNLIERHQPRAVVLVAGAVPHMRRLQEQTWETFSVNWHTDVRVTFHWLRAALLAPLAPGSRVVVISSGAALNTGGSPLSGGYAGAKSTQRYITGYAQGESKRDGLDLTFTSILPRFAPETGVGAPAVAAYAKQAGLPVDRFLSRLGPLLTPEIAGKVLVDLLAANAADVAAAYELDGTGLHPLS